MRGIDLISAAMFLAEIGDLSRFQSLFRDSWRQIGTKLIKECTWAKFLCMRKYLGRF